MDYIGYTLYKLLNNNKSEIEQIINLNGLENLLLHNGCLSNILLFYINNNNNDKIEYILQNKNLMKRDYLNICKYFYNEDYNKSLLVFKKINYNNLEMKDIDFIINNSLIKLLYELEELFIYTTIETNITTLDNIKLKINNIDLINNIEQNIKINILNKLNKLNYNYDYDYIIDAGNILHSFKGSINENSINGLVKILNTCSNNNILIIIHNKHFKNQLIKNIIIKYNYFLTPYNNNDDLYILWFFLKKNTSIITNDKFKDHNYNLNFGYNYNILLQYIINYTNKYEFKYNNHNFIRKYNNNVYIPILNSNKNMFSVFS